MPAGDTLGQRIRHLRKQRGLSLAKVGGADFTRAWLSQIELGKATPSTRLLRVIAQRLDTPVEYLLEGREASIERELAIEKGRVLLARGEPRRAAQALRPALDWLEWPLGTDARLAYAEALHRMGRRALAAQVLARERRVIAEHGDVERARRATAIEAGGPPAADPDPVRTHLRLADRAQREARSRDALEHYRAARVLLEARPESRNAAKETGG